MRRWAPIATVIAVLLGALAPSAQGARVDSNEPGVGLTVQAAGERVRVVIEHFQDASRNGSRVRQISFGDPAIRSGDPDCDTNVLFNDVVCRGIPSLIQVDASESDDELVIGGSNAACQSTQGGTTIVTLRDGDDVLRSSSACGGQANAEGINRLHPIFFVTGGRGQDSLTGGALDDSLFGDEDADTILGRSGNDTLNGGAGPDSLDGQTGNDKLDGGTGKDDIEGGPGTDTVTYADRPGGVTVTLDGLRNDGASGETDLVTEVENIAGGGGRDVLTGDGGANTIEGGLGNDEITGGGGTDTLRGGDGTDLIIARDNGVRDVVSCGLGLDEVIADLEDAVETRVFRNQPRGSTCERVETFARDDGPPGQVVTRRVAIGGDGSLTMRLACPRGARVTCRGTLRLVDARRFRRTLASARYVARRGRTVSIRLRLSTGEARRVRARGELTTVTRERGVSRRGPRSAVNTVNVR